MPYDPMTLWALVVFLIAMMSTLLVLTFFTTSRNPALLQWAAAMSVSGFGIAAIAARGHIPHYVSIEMANAAILAGAGLMWNGFRTFDGRRARISLPLALVALWLGACELPLFANSVPNRVMLMSVLMLLIDLAAIRELLVGKERSVSRCIVVGILALQGLVLASRMVVVQFVAFPDEGVLLTQPNSVIGGYGLANVAFLVLFTFAIIAMVRDRRELAYKRDSLIDDLTGLLNRRGFMDSAARACAPGRGFAVLAMDLDRFKQVNDRHGHAAGDAVLVLFGQVLRSQFRAGDVVARTGGEEFGVLMPGASEQDAGAAAERVRVAFRREAAMLKLEGVVGTVSIGVAMGQAPQGAAMQDIGPLLARADAALYIAKAQGRDRVETARGEPPLLRVVSNR